MEDRDRTVSRRSEPSSRTALIGEQPNPWDLLQPPGCDEPTSRCQTVPSLWTAWALLACYPRSTFYPFSDGASTHHRQITKTCFRTCSTCLSRSQATFCLCTHTLISNQREVTFAHLRYSLGGNPPQSNRPPDTVRATDSGPRVRHLTDEGWYFTIGSIQPNDQISQPPTYPTHRRPSINAKLQSRFRGLTV